MERKKDSTKIKFRRVWVVLALIMFSSLVLFKSQDGLKSITGFATKEEAVLKNAQEIIYDGENKVIKAGSVPIPIKDIDSARFGANEEYLLIEYKKNYYLKKISNLKESEAFSPTDLDADTVKNSVNIHADKNIFGDDISTYIDANENPDDFDFELTSEGYTFYENDGEDYIETKEVDMKNNIIKTKLEKIPPEMATALKSNTEIVYSDWTHIKQDGKYIRQTDVRGDAIKIVTYDGKEWTTTIMEVEGEEITYGVQTITSYNARGQATKTQKQMDDNGEFQPIEGSEDKSTEAAIKEYEDKNGLENIIVPPNGDGLVTFHAKGSTGEFTVKPKPLDKGDYVEPEISFKKGNREVKISKKEGFLWDSEKYDCGGKSCKLSTDCKGGAENCLVTGKDTVYLELTEKEAELFADPDEIDEIQKDSHKAARGELSPEAQELSAAYHQKLRDFTSSKIQEILNGYLNELLGPFSKGVPAWICGDSMYKEETNWDNSVAYIPVPQSTYRSEMERKITRDVRTVIVSGKVEELTESLYRYEVLVKLIGDRSTGKWELYLYNSCDKEDSKEQWYEYGSIGYGQIFVELFAGQKGDDMIFECKVDEFCKFDQVCIKFEGEKEKCFVLQGSITKVCH